MGGGPGHRHRARRAFPRAAVTLRTACGRGRRGDPAHHAPRPAPAPPGPPRPAAPPGPQAPGSATTTPAKHHSRKHRASHHRARRTSRPQAPGREHRRHRAHPRIPRLRQGLRGFDSCTTPSLSAMRAWRRTFSATAVYIGGVEAGCASPNLTAGWVGAMTGMGWSLMPTYVGRQASCSCLHGPDPARPRRGPGPRRGPRRDPPGRRPGNGPRYPHLLRHGGLPRAPALPGRHPGLPGRLDPDAARPATGPACIPAPPPGPRTSAGRTP